MKIEFHRDESAFETLAGEWNQLVERGVSNLPFLRHEYQRAWWANMGGGEWPRAVAGAAATTLLIAAGRDESGGLVGIAPLFFVEQNLDGQAAVLFVGSIEISDYLDFIVESRHLERFTNALLEALAGPDLPAWEVVDLYNLPEASPTPAALENVAAARGWRVTKGTLQPCPAVALPGEWDAYLASLNKKQRHEIRRKLRRAEANHTIAWHIVGPQADIEAEIERFMAMMTYYPDKANFLTETMRSQFCDSVRAAHQQGWLQLSFLTVDGKPAASYLNFDYDDKLWVYNSALDPQFRRLSAGWVLLSHLIRWAIENGRREVDFLRGDEDYKFKFGGVAREIYRVTIRR